MMKTTLLTAATLAVAFTAQAENVQLSTTRAGGVSESLRQEAQVAINSGMDWLIARQNPAGYWSIPDFPALTALPLWALLEGGSTRTDVVAKARAYILSCVNPDGTICREPAEKRKGGGLCNYNTALCMVALHRLGEANLVEIVQHARTAVAKSQHQGDDIYNGGMGYDSATGRPYADLSNSYLAYEAMRLTQNVEDARKAGDPKADLDWAAARAFVTRIQNLPSHNDQAWAKNAAPEDVGGFAYKPDSSMAGSETNAEGAVRLRSYGSMTYAGLLSLIYADVDKKDPRVDSAFKWAAANWSLDKNPGMDQQGLYYFYNVLSKSLAAYGYDRIPVGSDRSINWREELIRKLLSLKKTEADTGRNYWVNSEGRWMETDPVLVTSYSLLALRIALGQ